MSLASLSKLNLSINAIHEANRSKLMISGLIFLLFIMGSYIFIKFEESLVVRIQETIIADLNESLGAKEQVELADLTQRIHFNGTILGELIAQPLFNLHDIESALVHFLDIPEVMAIRVIDNYTKLPYTSVWREPSLGVGDNFPFDLNLSEYERFETLAFFEGKNVGKVEIYYSTQSLHHKIQEIRESTLSKAQENEQGINEHLRQIMYYQGLAIGGLFIAFIVCLVFENYYGQRNNFGSEKLFRFVIDIIRVVGFFLFPAIGFVGLVFRDYLWTDHIDIGGLFLLLPIVFALSNKFFNMHHEQNHLQGRVEELGFEAKQLLHFKNEFQKTILENEYLTQQAQISKTLLDHEPDPAIAVDAQQQVVFSNAHAEHLFSISPDTPTPQQLMPYLKGMKFLPYDPMGEHEANWINTTFNGKEYLFRVQTIPSPVNDVTLLRFRMISRNQENSNIATSYLVRQTSDELDSGVAQVRQIEQYFHESIQSFLFHGKGLAKQLKEVGDSLEQVSLNFRDESKNIDCRTLIVELMSKSLEVWEQNTGKGKLELAEESEIWRVSLDQGSYKTRTLDKYLQIRSLPKKPRTKDVIDTVDFILQACAPQGETRNKLQEGLAQLKNFHQLG